MYKRVGLGFRKDIYQNMLDMHGETKPAFFEIAPENWIDLGGYWGKVLKKLSEENTLTCHGLSLSIGSPDPLNWDFIKKIKHFLDIHNIQIYSEHLSYSQCANAHLYDLLPIPFREDAVKHIVQRIKEVQDYLEKPLALENVSYYTPVAAEMTESEFISAIVNESGCRMLLDINNVYVNAFNHNYNPHTFIQSLPLDKVAYCHMAGHLKIEEDLIIDTHGEAIIDEVFALYEWALPLLKPVPILLERDFNFPEMHEIHKEMHILEKIAKKTWHRKEHHVA
jgi:uncharacterized protein (UPF0276 family)